MNDARVDRGASHGRSRSGRRERTAPERFEPPGARRRRFGIYALFAAVVLEAAAAALTSPALKARAIRVELRGGVTDAERFGIRLAATPSETPNIILSRPGDIEARLKSLPFVSDARVSRTWKGELRAAVTVRAPVAFAKTSSGEGEIDQDGSVVRNRSITKGLPTIEIEAAARLEPGSLVTVNGIRSAVRLAQLLRTEPGFRGGKIHVEMSGDLCFNMADGVRVRLGDAADLEAKVALVRRLYQLDAQASRNLALIDVSCLAAPSCVPLRRSGSARRA